MGNLLLVVSTPKKPEGHLSQVGGFHLTSSWCLRFEWRRE